LSQPLLRVRLNPESITIDEKWRTRKFRDIKYESLKSRTITEADGIELKRIARKQYLVKIKQGSYHALCGKKFLVNNYQPAMARKNVIKAIGLHPLRLDNYLLYTISYLPRNIINWLYKSALNNI
jgi:hypothetical protein